LPTILSYGDYVQAGGLMSYGPDFTDLFRRAADMVDKILHGTSPATSRSSGRPSSILPLT
jgi:putative ABC transport system substrate-binding protein